AVDEASGEDAAGEAEEMPMPGDVIRLRQHAEHHGSAVCDEDDQADDEIDDLAQDVIGEPGAHGQIAEEAEDDARGADDVLARQSGQPRPEPGAERSDARDLPEPS